MCDFNGFLKCKTVQTTVSEIVNGPISGHFFGVTRKIWALKNNTVLLERKWTHYCTNFFITAVIFYLTQFNGEWCALMQKIPALSTFFQAVL